MTVNYLDYIETDGYCYFGTGYFPKDTTKVDATFTPVERVGYYGVFFGCVRADNSSATDTFYLRNNGILTLGNMQMRDGDKQVNGPTITLNTEYHITFGGGEYTVATSAETNTYTYDAPSQFTSLFSVFIGGGNNNGVFWKEGGGTPRSFAAKYGEFKFYENDVLVADLRPAEDLNGAIGFYDSINDTFHPKEGDGVATAGPYTSSVVAIADKQTLPASGYAATVEVTCANAWTSAGETWLQLSATAGTGDDTITATAPSYTGNTARTDLLVYTDAVTSDNFYLQLKQKKYTDGQPFYLGGNEVAEAYLGGSAVSEAYLGEELVYSAGSFMGIKTTPTALAFNQYSLQALLKITASEPWTLTAPAWIDTGRITGGTSGETYVALEATAQQAATSGTITITSANYSTSVEVNYDTFEQVKSIYNGGTVNLGFMTGGVLNWTFNGQLTGTDGTLIIGGSGGTETSDYRWFYTAGGAAYFDMGSGRITALSPGITLNTDVTINCGYYFMKINGTNWESGAEPTSPALPFVINTDKCKLYSFTCQLADIIPVKDGRNNLYLINRTLNSLIPLPSGTQYEPLV